VRPVRSKE